MSGLSTRNKALSRDSAVLCQVSSEPEPVSKLSGASSTAATPVVVDKLSEEVKCSNATGKQRVLF